MWNIISWHYNIYSGYGLEDIEGVISEGDVICAANKFAKEKQAIIVAMTTIMWQWFTC